MMKTTRHSMIGLASALGLTLAVMAAPPGIDDTMQSDVMAPPTSQPATAPAADAPADPSPGAAGLLAGPQVRSDAMDASMINGRTDRTTLRNQRETIASARSFFASVLTLPLTAEQRPIIRRLVLDYQKEAVAFGREYGPTLRSLEQKIREARQGQGRLNTDMLEEFQDLAANRPQPEPVQYEIWKSLTPAQQAELRRKLKEREDTASDRPQRPMMNRDRPSDAE